ncbi:MAG: hypothetical protein ACI810_002989 [Gammaproteobacteria bacterium]|jgi:hypothetical protein
MAVRGQRSYRSSKTKQPITEDEKYMMVMLFQYQKVSVIKLASKFGLNTTQVKDILGRRVTGGVCG